jgi:hypothetical protein
MPAFGDENLRLLVAEPRLPRVSQDDPKPSLAKNPTPGRASETTNSFVYRATESRPRDRMASTHTGDERRRVLPAARCGLLEVPSPMAMPTSLSVGVGARLCRRCPAGGNNPRTSVRARGSVAVRGATGS